MTPGQHRPVMMRRRKQSHIHIPPLGVVENPGARRPQYNLPLAALSLISPYRPYIKTLATIVWIGNPLGKSKAPREDKSSPNNSRKVLKKA
jgi:hypothetical protein